MPEGRWVTDEGNTRRGEAARVLEPALAPFLGRAMRRVVTEGTAARFLAGVTPPSPARPAPPRSRTRGRTPGSSATLPTTTQGGRQIAFGVIVEHGGYGGRLAAPAAGEIVQAAAQLGILKQQP